MSTHTDWASDVILRVDKQADMLSHTYNHTHFEAALKWFSLKFIAFFFNPPPCRDQSGEVLTLFVVFGDVICYTVPVSEDGRQLDF